MHRFAEFLGIKLYLFQKILIYFMNINTYVMIVASRGVSKSFTIAVFCILRCILYPDTKIVIASGVKNQAGLIITQKIKKELLKYPAVELEIKNINTGAQNTSVEFHNRSSIEAVVSNDGSRGYRANILILEEFRMISKEVMDTVLIPFLNVKRVPPYMLNEKYSAMDELNEKNVQIYISSAYFKSHWMWKSMIGARNSMLKGSRGRVFFALDYLLSIHHRMMDKEEIEEKKASPDFDPIGFSMEYENIMFGQSSDALFTLEDIEPNRVIENIFYPHNNIDYIASKEKNTNFELPKYPKRKGEIRILSVDVALVEGSNNDNTIIKCWRLLPEGNYYRKKVVYIESVHGMLADKQAIRIKQIFKDFTASYVALDTAGLGVSVLGELMKVQWDEDRLEEYDAWSSFNNNKLKVRDINAVPVIFSINATKDLNHNIIVSLRNNLKNQIIELPINELDAREIKKANDEKFEKMSPEEQARIIRPFLESTKLVNEMVNLEKVDDEGKLGVKKKSGQRKDRYSALAYGNWLAKHLEEQNLQRVVELDEYDDSIIMM